MKKPHIIIFNPDSYRGDVLGHMGNPGAVTPNLDSLVQEDAVSFRNAFCQNPVCTPSRCSFMSGWYPHVRGHRTMFHMMKPDEPVLLKTLKNNGYFVWWGGKNDLVPSAGGFEDYCHVKYEPKVSVSATSAKPVLDEEWRGRPGEDSFFSFYIGRLDKGDEPHYPDKDWAYVQGAIDLIKNDPLEQPLCIYLPLSYPHPTYKVEEPWFSMIDRSRLPERIPMPQDNSLKPSMTRGLFRGLGLGNWDEERWKELKATYYGMCARVDHQFGLLMKALKERGIYDDTAVFMFSDHGDFTGDYSLVEKSQNTFEDCLTRVPLVVKPPGSVRVKAGVSDAMVELVDFPATVAELTGIEFDYSHFGQSLLPVIAGDVIEHKDAVFAEGGRLAGEEHCKDITNKNVIPEDLYFPRGSMHRSDGPEHTKATMCRTSRYKYVQRLYEQDELYDLVADPGETSNKVLDPDYIAVLSNMKDRMLQFYQETCDVVPMERDNR
jgi:arylsulfatase A-like enzyme